MKWDQPIAYAEMILLSLTNTFDIIASKMIIRKKKTKQINFVNES